MILCDCSECFNIQPSKQVNTVRSSEMEIVYFHVHGKTLCSKSLFFNCEVLLTTHHYYLIFE